MKNLICTILCLVTLMGNPINASAKSEISLYLENGDKTITNFSINSNGIAQVSIGYKGTEQITAGATMTTQLQKRFLLVFWTDVDGGYWVDESDKSSYTAIHTLAVEKGTYRIRVEYLFYGTDGSVETVNDQVECTYK